MANIVEADTSLIHRTTHLNAEILRERFGEPIELDTYDTNLREQQLRTWFSSACGNDVLERDNFEKNDEHTKGIIRTVVCGRLRIIPNIHWFEDRFKDRRLEYYCAIWSLSRLERGFALGSLALDPVGIEQIGLVSKPYGEGEGYYSDCSESEGFFTVVRPPVRRPEDDNPYDGLWSCEISCVAKGFLREEEKQALQSSFSGSVAVYERG